MHWSWKPGRVQPEDRGFATDCLIWQLAIDRDGYGQVKVGSRTDGTRRQMKAHRLAWINANGEIPEGALVNHRCRQKDCVNPEHLELVTMTGNIRRDHSHTTLTAALAEQIRGHKGSHMDAAARFGISYETARLVRVGKTWNPEKAEVV